MHKTLLLTLFGLLQMSPVFSQNDACSKAVQNDYVSFSPVRSSISLVNKEQCMPIVYAEEEWTGVKRAAMDLADDIHKVSRIRPLIMDGSEMGLGKNQSKIIIGTLGKSHLIDSLITLGKLEVEDIRGQWESYITQTIDKDLIIAGSDKRGTIYGIYDLSEKIGVSPWYWWADVTPEPHSRIFIQKGRYVQPSPKVKYRGIFINDEEPSFGSWSRNHFGGYNSKMYTHLFELLLRLKANYFWPAMWNARFNEDDILNPQLADEYGIVMGTSHHEPMMRAHKEYVVRRDSIGVWDYKKNKTNIYQFFSEGIKRNSQYENIITLGMRGDGDVAMGKGDDTENINTLKEVIFDQREIIHDIYGHTDVPQLWAVFTEVQRYYDAGMTVPDDVTLLFCDNNWGYIRRKGPVNERDRKGGMGLYYHIDMNGGPWNDRWVNTTTIPKLREQLNLAYQSGIDRIWLINVGDLKPKEVPIDFIMHYAWDPEAIQPGDEMNYLTSFSANAFGEKYAKEIAGIIARYSKYNLWRKPEVETTNYFSVENNHEARHLITLWNQLKTDAIALSYKIPEPHKDAFFQLVYYPTVASAGVALIYLYTGMHNYYAQQGIETHYADSVKVLFELDKKLAEIYNDSLSDGKWRGMMNDVHIGYKKWSMPAKNELPAMIEPVKDGGIVAAAENDIKEISIAAYRYDKNIAGKHNKWIVLPDLGRGKACMGAKDVVSEYDGDIESSPRLEYYFETDSLDLIQLAIGILPTQDVSPARGLRLAVSIDHYEPQIIDARRGLVDTFDEYSPRHIRQSKVLKPLPPINKDLYLTGYGKSLRNEIFDNLRWLDASFTVDTSIKKHLITLYMIDPEIVLERLIINPDNSHPSYFGSAFDWEGI